MYLLLFIILCPVLTAQSLPGTRQSALSHSDIAFCSDIFSVFGNPAAPALINWREAGVYYSPSPFGLKELAMGSVAYNEPVGFGSLTAGYTTFGYDLYRENKFLFAVSSEAANSLYIGIAGNYHFVDIANYGNSGVLFLNFGTIVLLYPEFNFGFSVLNFNKATFSAEDDQILVVFKSGITYNKSDLFYIHFSLHKDPRYNFTFSGGFEYNVFNILFLRSGFSTDPQVFSAGAGIHFNIFSFDYSLTFHPELGLTHQAGIILSFKEVK